MLGENAGRGRRRTFFATLFFVLGFSCVFIILSVVFSSITMMLSGARQIINIVSGCIVILFGLHTLFNLLPFFNYEKKFELSTSPKTFAGAFIFGAAFGAGWTPCIGPILSSILIMASQNGKPALAVLYLLFYSAGLGLPFVLAAAFTKGFSALRIKMLKILPTLRIVSGVLVVCIGVLILMGRSTLFNSVFAKLGWSFAP
jgi:cytochrome c-type biogenesis protein